MIPMDPDEVGGLVDSVMPEPVPPARLPFGVTVQAVQAWRDALDGLPDDAARVRAVREEMRALRALSVYATVVQRRAAIRMYLTGATVRAVAKAAGVSDTYVSRRIRKVGLEGRQVRKSRQGR